MRTNQRQLAIEGGVATMMELDFDKKEWVREFKTIKKDYIIEDRERYRPLLNIKKDIKDFFEEVEKEEKIINDFLCQMPEGGIGHQIMEIKDLERVLENETRTYKVENSLLREFAATVRAECVMEQNFFSFYDIPDLIVKKKFQRKDFESIIKMLTKIKKAYLIEKADILKDKNKALEEIVITDEDLIPLDLFDKVLQSRDNKQELKRL